MSAFKERIVQDIKKLDELSEMTNGKIKIVKSSGNPPSKIEIELGYATAPSSKYPDKVQEVTQVVIELLSKYPIQEPSATIKTPIYHPNVYSSGKVCFGTKWLPTEGLDLLTKRIIKIITFDPDILNDKSPANGDALSWYKKSVKKFPSAFPTEKLVLSSEVNKPKISWSNVNEKIIIDCPNCGAKLRVAKGQTGSISCPKCETSFYKET